MIADFILKDMKLDKTKAELQGKTVLIDCPSCNESVHFFRLNIKTGMSLYGFSLKAFKNENILICPKCESVFAYEDPLTNEKRKAYPGDFKAEYMKKIR
ncbi:MAG: hypothetical protein Q4E28_04425 [Clostridia bacterium]|nr:hypothetical protein [Clostridia bacterium]